MNRQFIKTSVLAQNTAKYLRECAKTLQIDAITIRTCPGNKLLAKRREMAELMEEKLQIWTELAAILGKIDDT